MIKIEITKDILSVLPLIQIKQTENGVEISNNDLFYINGVVDVIMMAIGEHNNHIPGSEKSFEGKKWPEELENRAWDVYEYIKENLDEILSIALSHASDGIKEGVYRRKESLKGIWTFKEF